MSRPDALLFRVDGVELVDGAGRTLWASDSDEGFRRRFREFVGVDAAGAVIEHLLRRGVLAGHELERLRVFEVQPG